MPDSVIPSDLSGVLVVGRFAGVSSDFPQMLVDCDYRKDGQPATFQRQIGFRAFSPTTGERTEVGKGLEGLKVGDRCAVGVMTDVRQGVAKASGKPYAMVTLTAVSVTPLGSDVAPRRASAA